MRNGYGEGDVLYAAKAKEAGLIDRIDTLANVIAKLGGVSGDNERLRAAARLAVAAV